MGNANLLINEFKGFMPLVCKVKNGQVQFFLASQYLHANADGLFGNALALMTLNSSFSALSKKNRARVMSGDDSKDYALNKYLI